MRRSIGWGRSGRRARHGGATALVLALTLVAGACKGSGEAAETTTTEAAAATTPPPTNAPPPTVTPESQALLDNPDAAIHPFFLPPLQDRPNDLAIVRGYVRAEQAWIKAGMAPVNPDHPDLLATTKGTVLTNRQKVMADMRDRGEAYQAPRVLKVSPRRIVADGSSMKVELCISKEIPLYTVATGAVRDDELFSEDAYAIMEKVGDQWVLSGRGSVGETRDGEACDG